MSKQDSIDVTLALIEKNKLRYNVRTLEFIDSLIYTIQTLTTIKHVTSRHIVDMIPKLVVTSFGLLWKPALESYALYSYNDIKQILDLSVQAGLLKTDKQDDLDYFTTAEKEIPMFTRILDYELSNFRKNLDKKLIYLEQQRRRTDSSNS